MAVCERVCVHVEWTMDDRVGGRINVCGARMCVCLGGNDRPVSVCRVSLDGQTSTCECHVSASRLLP